jgi:hypothetical protein
VSIIDGGDHFLMGRSTPVSEATTAFVKNIIDA